MFSRSEQHPHIQLALVWFILSVVSNSVTSRTAARQASLRFTINWSWLTHVHWVSDVTQPSYPLLPPSPPVSIFPSIRVFSNELALRIKWPKYWSFSFSISPSNEYSGLFSFRIDWFVSKGLSRVFSSTTVWKHQFIGTQPSLWVNSHIHTWLLEKP